MTRIPLVRLCEVTDCGFNEQNMCHAAAIQVGDEVAGAVATPRVKLQDPRCDTYTRRPGAHLGASDWQGMVGSCKVESCSYNSGFRCTAEAIIVSRHEGQADGHADCKTYNPRV